MLIIESIKKIARKHPVTGVSCLSVGCHVMPVLFEQ
jgi:hypothetical protein